MNEVTDAPAQDQAEAKLSLGRWLGNKFSTYKNDRKAAEEQWMTNLRQYLGKYDPDMEQLMAPGKSRAYPKRTRVKVVSMASRLMSLLFPLSEKNWSLTASRTPSLPAEALVEALENWRAANPDQQPTQKQLDTLLYDAAKAAAELQEKVITDQLQDVDPYGSCDYETLVRSVVHSAVLYGPGVIKGPNVVAARTSKYQLDAAGVVQVLDVDTYRPYYEFVPVWNYYPDMGASTFAQMDGEFQRHIYSRVQLSALAKREDFDGAVINEVIRRMPEGDHKKHSYETELQGLGGQAKEAQDSASKYELLEYWGAASGKMLREAGVEGIEDDELEHDVRCTLWLLDKKVIKAARSPFGMGTKIYHQFIFEDDEVNLMGSGLPPIMRDSQLAVASFSRMLVDNASTVCGPNVEVNVDLLSPTQTNLDIQPFRVWLREGRQEQGQAVRSISFDSHIPELLQAIARFDQFADGETFVSPVAGGDVEGVSGEALRTTGGASMIYANAALPYKDIVRNFDRFTVGVIQAQVEWNRMFHEDRDRMRGDVRPVARGATSLMAKEVRAFALDQLAATLSQEDRDQLRPRVMLTERLKAHDLLAEELLDSEENVAARQEERSRMQQEQQAQQSQMLAAQLRGIEADTTKALSQAQKNLDNADVAVLKTLLEALKNGTAPDELVQLAQRTRKGGQGTEGQPAQPAVGGLPQ